MTCSSPVRTLLQTSPLPRSKPEGRGKRRQGEGKGSGEARYTACELRAPRILCSAPRCVERPGRVLTRRLISMPSAGKQVVNAPGGTSLEQVFRLRPRPAPGLRGFRSAALAEPRPRVARALPVAGGESARSGSPRSLMPRHASSLASHSRRSSRPAYTASPTRGRRRNGAPPLHEASIVALCEALAIFDGMTQVPAARRRCMTPRIPRRTWTSRAGNARAPARADRAAFFSTLLASLEPRRRRPPDEGDRSPAQCAGDRLRLLQERSLLRRPRAGLTEEVVAMIDDGYEGSALSDRHKAARLADAFLQNPRGLDGESKAPTYPPLPRRPRSSRSRPRWRCSSASQVAVALGTAPESMPTTVLPTLLTRGTAVRRVHRSATRRSGGAPPLTRSCRAPVAGRARGSSVLVGSGLRVVGEEGDQARSSRSADRGSRGGARGGPLDRAAACPAPSRSGGRSRPRRPGLRRRFRSSRPGARADARNVARTRRPLRCSGARAR